MPSSQQVQGNGNGISIGYGMVVLLALGVLVAMRTIFASIRVEGGV